MHAPEFRMSTAIILAGGLGTRLRSSVPNLPKPMAPVNGHPFLSYLLDYWIKQGVRRFILSVGYKSSAIQDYYGNHYHHVELIYSVEETPLGTGGGMLLALQKLQGEEDFLVLNGDTFFTIDLELLRACHNRAQADVTMALLDVEDNDRYEGVSMNADGRIVSINARCREGLGNNRINGGVYLIRKNLFEAYEIVTPPQPCSLENDMFPALLQNGGYMLGYLSSDKFIDIGMPKDYRKFSTLMKEFIQ